MDINNFQRIGSISNADVGRRFEALAQEYFRRRENIELAPNYPVGVSASQAKEKKQRHFDLGSDDPPVLVECKSHRWTASGNVPSAKITVWSEAMYFFLLAPAQYRKVLFVLKDYSQKHKKTLAQYYVANYGHLIPDGVEILEFEEDKNVAARVTP